MKFYFNSFLTTGGIFLLSMFIGQSATWATQPTPPKIQIETEITGKMLHLQAVNLEKLPAIIEFAPGELSSLSFPASRKEIASGQKVSLDLELRGLLKARQVLHLTSRVLLEKEAGLIPGPSVYQVFYLNGQTARKLSFEDAFLNLREKIEGKSQEAKIDLGGTAFTSEINRLAFKAKAIPEGLKIEPMQARDPREYAKIPLKQLPRDYSVGGSSVTGMEYETLDALEPEFMSNPSEDSSRLPESLFTPDNYFASATLIKGHMSLRTAASTYKAAWGWVVRAWQNISGIWVFQGWTYVGGDGSWQISLAAPIPGVPVRIEYLTKNRFVSIQDAQGRPYTWGDNWTLTGGVTDIGYRYADLTVNGDLPAVDKLYVGATQIWVKFFNLGMNALRDEPIQVTFPNSLASGQCIYNDGAGPYAWSCSYWADGRIYVIPEHGSESVVQHEIAHSINSYYWNGNMPAGAGGSHNLWNCYNNGLALTEGFANFLTYWTQFDRGNSAPVAPYFNMNIESIPGGVCANQTAEMRVASTFWDIYDTHSENISSTVGDGIHYVSQASPVAIYLGNKRNSMAEYLPVVQSGQSAFFQNEFTRIFRLGKIIP